MNIKLQQAEKSAEQIVSDLRAAHKAATRGNQYLEIILIDLIRDAANLKNRVTTVAGADVREAKA